MSVEVITIDPVYELNDHPKDWDEAKVILAYMNEGKDEGEYNQPMWEWDCNFKLDYDGGLVNILSRFYPPNILRYGPGWDGNVHVYLLGKEIKSKSFNEPTWKELHTKVEAYVKELVDKLDSILINL